jgi:hypothetical protein
LYQLFLTFVADIYFGIYSTGTNSFYLSQAFQAFLTIAIWALPYAADAPKGYKPFFANFHFTSKDYDNTNDGKWQTDFSKVCLVFDHLFFLVLGICGPLIFFVHRDNGYYDENTLLYHDNYTNYPNTTNNTLYYYNYTSYTWVSTSNDSDVQIFVFSWFLNAYIAFRVLEYLYEIYSPAYSPVPKQNPA